MIEELEELLKNPEFNGSVTNISDSNMQILGKQWLEWERRDPERALMARTLVDKSKLRTKEFYEGFLVGANRVMTLYSVVKQDKYPKYVNFASCYAYAAHRIQELKNQS